MTSDASTPHGSHGTSLDHYYWDPIEYGTVGHISAEQRMPAKLHVVNASKQNKSLDLIGLLHPVSYSYYK